MSAKLFRQVRKVFVATLHMSLLATLVAFAMTATSASAQITAIWSSGTGDWEPCPQQNGTALWSTCPIYPGANDNTDTATIQAGTVTVNDGIVIGNLSVGASGSLIVTPGYINISGSGNVVNNGSIVIGPGDGFDLIGQGSTVTLSGKGTVSLTSSNSFFAGTAGSTPTLINQSTITGLGVGGNEGFSVTNQGTINANGGTLTVHTSGGGITNTGTMNASSSSNLSLITPGITNTGGTIEALAGGTVTLDSNVTGGTLTTAGSGIIQLMADSILSNLTNTGALQLAANTALLQNTITNNSTISVQSAATLFMSGAVTLTGSGSLNLSGSGQLESNSTSVGLPGGSLISQQLIQGSGTIYQLPLTNQATINANTKGGTLSIAGGAVTNTSTLEASNGGTLQIETVVNNSGGVIEAETGSTVLLTSNFNGSINGGEITNVGTGLVNCENCLLDGTVNIPTNAGKLTVKGGNNLFLQGTINNTGTIALSNNSCIALNEPTTLTGSGHVTLVAGTCIYGSGIPFTNSSTIEGAGLIGDSNPMPITNTGTILANAKTPLLIVPNASGFTNTGKLTVNPGSTLTIKGLFNNLSTTGVLTSGTYTVTGTLGVPGAVVTNDASITLSGAAAQLSNTNTGMGALSTLTSNASAGVLTLENGQALVTGTNYANAGKTTVAKSSSFTVGGAYTQSAGTTTIDGTLTASGGLLLSKGSLLGQGTLAAPVTSSGTITVGDATTKPGKLTITGSYGQNSTGALNVAIGGTTAGTQYSQLAVSNGVSLNGKLALKVVNGFVPAIGDTFTILTGSAISGEFSSVTGLTINSGEHFEVSYSGTAVTLTVASGS